MARVFLSYSRRNTKTAEKLAAKLRSSGHYPWIDSAQILVGDSIADTIQRAIESCEFLCFLVTKASLSSTWAREEVSTALSQELGSKSIKVLPLFADKMLDIKKLPPFLAGRKFADFRGSFDRGFNELLQALQAGRPLPENSHTDVTFYLRDVMETAIAIITDKFPEYKIIGIRDRNGGTKDWLSYSGNPGNCDIEWLFDLQKVAPNATGLGRMTAHLNPIWEIVLDQFPDVKEIMLWSTGDDSDDSDTIETDDIDCTAVDAEVIIFNVGQ